MSVTSKFESVEKFTARAVFRLSYRLSCVFRGIGTAVRKTTGLHIMRPCYDKSHRCLNDDCVPVHDGRGISVQLLRSEDYISKKPWAMGHCRHCMTLVLPHNIRHFDPSWHLDRIARTLYWLPNEVRECWEDREMHFIFAKFFPRPIARRLGLLLGDL